MKAELTISVRPVRHIYFIDEDDLERFVEVASYCCTQWGGINNLIVPVKGLKDPQDTSVQIHAYLENMMQRRHSDVFVDAVSGRVGNSSAHDALNTYLASVYPGATLQHWNTFIQVDNTLHPLNILSPQDNTSKPELAIPRFFADFSRPSSRLKDAISAAAFGEIWPDQWEEYKDTYTLKPWNASSPEIFLSHQLLIDPYASVINLTLKELHNLATENVFSFLSFDVVIVQNVWDLCWFWNLRAQSFGHHWLSDRRVLLLSKEQLFAEYGTYLDPLLDLIQRRTLHPRMEANLDVIFHHYHDEEIRQFLSSHSNLQKQEGDLRLNMHFSRRSSISAEAHDPDIENSGMTANRPIMYVENKVTNLSFSIYHEYGGDRPPTISQELTADSETFLVPHAGPRTGGVHDVYVALQSDFWNQFPCHPSVANLIIPNSSFDVFLNSIQLRYLLNLTPRGLERMTINIPKTWDIYRAYFHSRGYDVTPSDKKTYADGLLRMAGGFDQEKAQVLRSRIAREILDFLTDKATAKLAREMIRRLNLQSDQEGDLQQIITNLGVLPQNQRIPKAFGDIFSCIKDIQGLSSIERKMYLQNLAKLVGIKVVQRGMYIKCPHCGTRTWYGIYALDEQIRCNGCLDIFDLPLVENDNDGVERPFQYSLNPLTNQAMDQDVLPVIAALLTLKAHHSAMYHVVMGMNFQKVGNTNRDGDFDFIYIYKHEFYGGECKSGGRFTIKDINTAKLAQALGFRTFFFVAMRPIEEDGQRLIDDYKQELANNRDDEHPFAIFVLNDQVLFGESPLPKGIPQ